MQAKYAGTGRNVAAWTFLHLYWPRLLLHSMWLLTEIVMRVSAPLVLREFLQWQVAASAAEAVAGASGGGGGGQVVGAPPEWQGWLLALALGALGFSISVVHHQFFWTGMRMGFGMRQQAIAAIHAKVSRGVARI